MHREVNQFGNEMPAFGDSMAGCTATVALITSSEIYVANAGDSRTVVSINGTAKNLSEDHKPNLPHEKQRIDKNGGFVQMNRVRG